MAGPVHREGDLCARRLCDAGGGFHDLLERGLGAGHRFAGLLEQGLVDERQVQRLGRDVTVDRLRVVDIGQAQLVEAVSVQLGEGVGVLHVAAHVEIIRRQLPVGDLGEVRSLARGQLDRQLLHHRIIAGRDEIDLDVGMRRLEFLA